MSLADRMTLPVFGSTVACAGLRETLTVNVPSGELAAGALRLGLAGEARGDAVAHARGVPGRTAVTFQTNCGVSPGASAPSAQVFV